MSSDPAFDQAATGYLTSLTHLHSPYGHGLAVCRICRGPTARRKDSPTHWEICRPCHTHRTTPGIAPGELADQTGFLIYALEQKNGSPDQALRDMYQYKLLPPAGLRQGPIPEPGQRIRTLLYIFLRDNLAVLANRFGPVDTITHVPSTSTQPNRDRRALADALDSALERLPGSAPHHRLLTPGRDTTRSSRTLDPDRFLVDDPTLIYGQHLLVVEDTWVTGASAQSAAIALHRAGARHVTVVCIARMLKATWPPAEYLTSQYDTFAPPRPGRALW